MERHPASPSFVGIDVSKDRLDVYVRPSGQVFAIARDGQALAQLVADLITLAPALIVLEATSGFETTVAAALASAGLPLAVVIHVRSAILPAPPDGSPRLTRSMLRSSPCSPNVFVPNHARSPTPTARAWPN